MNVPTPDTQTRMSARDLWSSRHAACEEEPTFDCFEEADFVRGRHGGHGPKCIRFLAAVAYLSGLSDDADHEHNPSWG